MSLFRIFGASSSTEREEEKAAEAANKDRLSMPPTNAHEAPRFDAVAVLESAGVAAEQRERVERTLELLRALPAETPASIRKNIVEASFKAFDISIKAIVEAATSEITAFNSFIAGGHKQLDELTKQSQERIAQLQAEIAKIQKRLELATADQASLDQATTAASERVRPVLGFFTEPPAPSKAEPAPSHKVSNKVANDTQKSHPPSMIIDESLTKAG